MPLLFLSIAILFLTGCSEGFVAISKPSVPPAPFATERLCDVAPSAFQDSKFETRESLEAFLESVKVKQVTQVKTENLVQFASELQKFPQPLLRDLSEKGVQIRILEGSGVGVDSEKFTAGSTTSDGRPWIEVPGLGGGFTAIAVNRLYEGHGSSNLVLHEHAHTLDEHGLPGSSEKISQSAKWKAIYAGDTELHESLRKICGDYCANDAQEAFAEAFALYFACENSRQRLLAAPETLEFFKSLR